MKISIQTIIILISTISKITSSLLFKVGPSTQQCFYDEFFQESSVILKWKIFTLSKQDISEILRFISIRVVDEVNAVKIFEAKIVNSKQKTTFTVKEEGQYKICFEVSNYGKNKGPKEQIFAYLKINSENMDDIKLNDVISYEDLDLFNNKTYQVKALADIIINNQNAQMDLENASSKETINNTKWYKLITYIQIFVIFIIGIIQLFNFKRFLNSQHVL